MPDGMYSVLALLPESSDFTLERAVAHFNGMDYRTFKVQAELATPDGKQGPSGFRAIYEDWAIVAWLELDESVLIESREMAESDDLPAPAEIIAGCSRRLSIWSDEDPDLMNTHFFEDFISELRQSFGAFIKDYVVGGWRT